MYYNCTVYLLHEQQFLFYSFIFYLFICNLDHTGKDVCRLHVCVLWLSLTVIMQIRLYVVRHRYLLNRTIASVHWCIEAKTKINWNVSLKSIFISTATIILLTLYNFRNGLLVTYLRYIYIYTQAICLPNAL